VVLKKFQFDQFLTRVATQLNKALSEKGLAFLVNHGISEEKLKVAWTYLDDFCELPTEVKEHYIRQKDANHGYVEPGQEKFNGSTPELRHCFNICTLSAKQLPEEPLPGFADHVAGLAQEFKSLAGFLLQAVALGLELQQQFFVEKHSHMLSGDHDNETTLRLLYYPPVIEDDNHLEFVKGRCKYSYQRCNMGDPDFKPEDPPSRRPSNMDPDADLLDDIDSPTAELSTNSEEKTCEANGCNSKPLFGFVRCGQHTDYGTFTLLSQDSEGGLEVKLPNSKKWHRVGHLPGAILINCGEILQMWTGDRYPALLHRVVVPEQEHIRNKGRHSIAYFCHPDNVTMISPDDLPHQAIEQDCNNKKPRKKSFRAAKEKVYNAYQLVQRRFKETYGA